MLTNLRDFYQKLSIETPRLTHQYKLNFIIPAELTVENPDADFININLRKEVSRQLEGVSIWAEGVQLPSVEIQTADLKHNGYVLAIPNASNISKELTLNLRLENQMGIYQAILFWMRAISDPNKNMSGDRTLQNIVAYIDLYDNDMKTVVLTYKLDGIYPISLGNIDLSNNEPEIATCEVTFKYQFWRISGNTTAFQQNLDYNPSQESTVVINNTTQEGEEESTEQPPSNNTNAINVNKNKSVMYYKGKLPGKPIRSISGKIIGYENEDPSKYTLKKPTSGPFTEISDF